jgi:hypothetical protein
LITRDPKEKAFLEQHELFLTAALSAFGYRDLAETPDAPRLALPLPPVVLDDFRRLDGETIAMLANGYHGEYGVSHFIALNPEDKGEYSHPLLEIASQLVNVLPLANPIEHPMEGHPEAASRFGRPDGTLKIYDLAKDGSTGYREQAETSEMFDAHNDGLGYAGCVEAVIFYIDTAPLWGGFTYFQNIVRSALDLARSDRDAFISLFLPDAITALRPRGKGAIRVSSPVLYLNDAGYPQTFFRISSGEYEITWRTGCAPLDRARKFLAARSQPFSPTSTFVHFDRPGAGCLIKNGWVVHGRTRFIDGYRRDQKRVLARKWFATTADTAQYRHVPGMRILDQFAKIYPERFGPEYLDGEWNYHPESRSNVRHP